MHVTQSVLSIQQNYKCVVKVGYVSLDILGAMYTYYIYLVFVISKCCVCIMVLEHSRSLLLCDV